MYRLESEQFPTLAAYFIYLN